MCALGVAQAPALMADHEDERPYVGQEASSGA